MEKTTDSTSAAPSSSRLLLTYSRLRRRPNRDQALVSPSSSDHLHRYVHVIEENALKQVQSLKQREEEGLVAPSVYGDSSPPSGETKQELTRRKCLTRVVFGDIQRKPVKRKLNFTTEEHVFDDGMDEEKRREEEKRLFGQVHSFIECTEHIQGNRYASKWKGSVLDSVVGAFLTQNVSDISSSSSFLSLMANFPLKENVAEQDGKRMRGQKIANARNLLGKGKKIKDFGWHSLKNEAYFNGYKYEETDENRDSLDWEVVQCPEVWEISDTIKTRGQSNVMVVRIKGFLNRLFSECGSLDLEWLRFIPPDETKYLLHYKMITFGKVFCTKKNPNCYSCPMKGECKYFASAHVSGASEGGCRQLVHTDMEDLFKQEENKFALQNMIPLIISTEATPTRDTKNNHVLSLRTMHDAYVLPDSHPLLEGMDRREYADPCPYLHVWTPETCNDNAHLSPTQEPEPEIFKGTI
ncbi:DEMETER-like protein 2 isoform X5 [Canna indica]|uniref:DEMETER-like protein 2 isoform X5 n=1 Tax=Canna indica TaxID=4628 RepID=A0AAQ3KV22_9LILI|nr:DEMETER-like protein 2 isoform X5 [Canna indica]